MKTLLFSPPKYNNSFITVNDCCWGTGNVQVFQDRLLRTGSYLMNQEDDVGFLDAGMCDMDWVDVWKKLKEIKPDRLIFGVTPQFESWQMIVADMCDRLEIEAHCIGIMKEYERHLHVKYDSQFRVWPSYLLCLPSWDKMPPINWSLIDKDYPCYFTYQISDGCPHKCKFCVWGKKDFKLLPPELVAENLKPINVSTPIYLLCAQITTNKKWLERFVELKKEFDLKFEYVTDINAQETSQEKIELLKNSGCVQVVSGFESTNENILEIINKKITVEDMENTIELCNKFDLPLHASFTYNIDPSENVDNDIKLYKKYKSFKPSPGIIKAYVGTELHDDLPDDHEYIMELGLHPLPTNKGVDLALEKLEKWEEVLG